MKAIHSWFEIRAWPIDSPGRGEVSFCEDPLPVLAPVICYEPLQDDYVLRREDLPQTCIAPVIQDGVVDLPHANVVWVTL